MAQQEIPIQLIEQLQKPMLYVPSLMLLVQIYMRLGKFDEAFALISELPNEFGDLIEEIHLKIWSYKRLHARRMIE